jgi:PTH1 family peptidyl-tRNA hydrolase
MNPISLIIGLGNIGRKYENTRHNLGFELLNLFAKAWGVEPRPGKGGYYFAEKTIEERVFRLIWPTTYMNNSGLAVTQSLEHFANNRLSVNDLLILYDDFNLPLGKIRIRTSGADGGHNGMASVIYHLGTQGILRLRMGVGPIPLGIDPIAFVLGQFSLEELEIKNKMLEKAYEAVLYLLTNDAEKAMSLYNQSGDDQTEKNNPAPDETKNQSGAV